MTPFILSALLILWLSSLSVFSPSCYFSWEGRKLFAMQKCCLHRARQSGTGVCVCVCVSCIKGILFPRLRLDQGIVNTHTLLRVWGFDTYFCNGQQRLFLFHYNDWVLKVRRNIVCLNYCKLDDVKKT